MITEHLEKHTGYMPTPARNLMFAPPQKAAAAFAQHLQAEVV